MTWLYLAVAIIVEVIASSALKTSIGFTKLVPSMIAIIGYIISLYFLSLALKYIPIGIAYAIWSGVGIVALACIGYFLYKQTLDIAAMIGLGFIILGVVIINVFSKSVGH